MTAKKELKVRIDNLARIEHRLVEIGAEFTHELQVIDTYFKQPPGFVLKIVEDESGNFLSRLEAHDGGFVVKERETLTNVADAKVRLTEQYGLHRVLQKRRKLYNYRNFTIDLNLIDGVGDFLILVGEHPEESIIEKDLGIVDPEYVRVPFSEL